MPTYVEPFNVLQTTFVDVVLSPVVGFTLVVGRRASAVWCLSSAAVLLLFSHVYGDRVCLRHIPYVQCVRT